MALDLSGLEKAILSLETALNVYVRTSTPDGSDEKEILRDGIIQRYEFTFELSWKMLKRYMEEYGLEKVDELTKKEFFRKGFEQGMLEDAEVWFEYLRNRQLTSHTYDEETAEKVYQSAIKFLPDARHLLERLKEKTK